MNRFVNEIDNIFPGEPIRYRDIDRWYANNGFRRRWLAAGARHSAVINAARRDDLETVTAFVRTMGGVTAPKTIARSIIKLAKKLPGDVKAYVVQQKDGRSRRVTTPNVSWRYKNGKQTGVIGEYDRWGTTE